MEVKEFEEALDEIESKLDRVRALYENWYRGYEKLEPKIPRKEVERKVYALRKEVPRNTSLRFRYNMLFQRYTTLSNYWLRTSKQIEEGTHRLQLQRLRRKHKAGELPDTSPRARRSRESEVPAPQSYELNLDEKLDVRDLLDESELDEVARAVDRPGRYSEPPPKAAEPARSRATFARPQGLSEARVNRAIPETGRYSEPPPSQRPVPAPPKAPPPPTTPQRTAAGLAGLPAPPGGPKPGGAALKPPPPPLPGKPGSPFTPSGVRPSQAEPAPKPAGAAPRPAASPTSSGAGLDDQRLRKLYDEYSSARRKNNEGDVRYDTLVNSIQRMLPELQKRHAGKKIDFEIVMKDGRVGLKPKPT
jgi:hypothetical protein